MAEFRISVRARNDLLDIYEFTEIKFGAYQAAAYHAGFEKTFSLISEFPDIGLPADELLKGIRRFRFQSHYIFYTHDREHVLIRAIIHTSQNVRPALFR